LDVAILQIVQSLSPHQPGISHLQHTYYSRLNQWRAEIMRRHREQSSQVDDDRDDILRNEYVAQLIQDEEELLWKQCPSVRRKGIFPELTGVSIVVAIGFRILLSRNAHWYRS
jgi:hypothetical protein